MKQIFVVEDEKDLVELLTYNLEKDGYRVLSEMDGEAALKKIPEKMPDLVLLGFDACLKPTVSPFVKPSKLTLKPLIFPWSC